MILPFLAVPTFMIRVSLVLGRRLPDMDPATQPPLMETASRDLGPREVAEEVLEGSYRVELKGSLFCGNAGPMRRRLEGLSEAEAVVMDLSDEPYIDQSGACAFADLIEQLDHHDPVVYIVGLQTELAELMHPLGFIPGLCREVRVLDHVSKAVGRASQDSHANHH